MDLKVERNEDGAIKKYVMEGTLIYASINIPNTKFVPDGIWETYFIPDDVEELETARTMGVKIKGWEDKEIPEAVYLKRYTSFKSGKKNSPPVVKDSDGQPFAWVDADSGREITVGNGTRARIQYHYWQLTNSYGTYNYYILDGVRILDLVERQELSDPESDF